MVRDHPDPPSLCSKLLVSFIDCNQSTKLNRSVSDDETVESVL
jgi:hypothetical protein